VSKHFLALSADIGISSSFQRNGAINNRSEFSCPAQG